MKLYVFILILLLGNLSILSAQGHIPIFSNLSGQELLDSLSGSYKPSTILNFANARDSLFGIVYNEEDTAALSDALKSVLCDASKARELARKGRDGVAADFTIQRTVEETSAVYRAIL